MGPLAQWLGDLDLPTFRRRHLQRAAMARPGATTALAELFGWTELDALLAQQPVPDVLVVSAGKALSVPAPRSLLELRALFARGIGIVVRHPERHSAALHELCSEFAQELPGEQRVLVFATPAGTHGFGWHYDPEDVFIAQTRGTKDYYFRRNTLVPSPARHGQPDFSVYARETSALMSCQLIRGDFLYVPRGFWHVAHPREDSLSVSIGVFPRNVQSAVSQAEAAPRFTPR
jgi:50S ribosomal protein L16 3-hydroxylase